MVGRHRIAEDRQGTRARHIFEPARLKGESLEIRRLLNVSRIHVPLIYLAGARRDLVPERVLLGELAVEPAIRVRIRSCFEHFLDLIERRPDVLEENVIAIFVLTDRFKIYILENGTRESKCDDERRRHEEIRLDVLMHPCLEVSIT